MYSIKFSIIYFNSKTKIVAYLMKHVTINLSEVYVGKVYTFTSCHLAAMVTKFYTHWYWFISLDFLSGFVL